MKLIRPKIIGTLIVREMMAGNLAVVNDIKNAPNKIIIPCRSAADGYEIIEQLKCSKPGEILHRQKFKAGGRVK
ncbi:hypothetical protein [Dyadobacter sp. SG02]|uniref:hypothetical protein n=1 Tax=Dyadobacter sp. SG02 TaxID=1855291 RepID=UPI000B84BB94|nr:hypothetical protein [Dyadobacter sp. SG02]